MDSLEQICTVLNSNSFLTKAGLGIAYKIASNVPYGAVLILGVHGTDPILTVVSFNNNLEPNMVELGKSGLIETTLLSNRTFKIEYSRDVYARIIASSDCTIEVIS